jgi:hypothetical protein
VTSGHYERFKGTWANMTTRRSEMVTTYCLNKISRRCDFSGDAPVRTTGYVDEFGDDCEDLGITRAVCETRSPMLTRPSSPSEIPNDDSSAAEAQRPPYGLREGLSSPLSRHVYTRTRQMQQQAVGSTKSRGTEKPLSSSPQMASQPRTRSEVQGEKRRRTAKL